MILREKSDSKATFIVLFYCPLQMWSRHFSSFKKIQNITFLTIVLIFSSLQGNWRAGLCWTSQGERESQATVWQGCFCRENSRTGQVRFKDKAYSIAISSCWRCNVCCVTGLLGERWRSFQCLSTLRATVRWPSFWSMRSFFRGHSASMRLWFESNPKSPCRSLRLTNVPLTAGILNGSFSS